MKKIKYFSLIALFVSLTACGDSKKEETSSDAQTEETTEANVQTLNLDNLVKEIEKREKDLEAGDTPNKYKKHQLIEAYVAYSERFGNRKNADEYLFRAARMSSEVGMTAESIKYFDRVYNEYERYEDRPMALFMKAFVLENHANNLEEAKLHYEKFIREYPTHDMADDARISIQNLGKSPEEIIKGFQKRDSLENAQKAV